MHDRIDSYFPGLLKDLQTMVAYRSDAALYNPEPGHPFGRGLTETLNAFLAIADGYGFHTRNLDNYVGYAETSDDESLPLYGIMAHLDVVPVGDESLWKYPPWGGVIDNGRLYGRGSFDDKGPAVAALHAMRAVRDSVPLKCRLRLIVGIDEETGAFRCLKHYKQESDIPVASFSPDGAFPLINAEKGIIRITVEKQFTGNTASQQRITRLQGGIRTNVVPGKAFASVSGVVLTDGGEGIAIHGSEIEATGISTHVKLPWEGKNAILLLLQYLAGLDIQSGLGHYVKELNRLFRLEYTGQGLGIAAEDDVSGILTASLSVIDADETHCSLKIDIRHPVTVERDTVVDKLRQVFAKLGAVLRVDSFNNPLYVPEDTPFVQLLLGAYSAVTGNAGRPLSTGGGTYCRDMPRSVSFGILFPGEESVAHCVDEYVSLESLNKAAHIYVEAFNRINQQV